MKNMFLTILLFSGAIVFAQDNTEYKYEPEANKAEYFIGTYNTGKDLDDLVSWYNKFAKWTKGQDGAFDSMSTAILTPVFHSNLNAVEVMWSNNWPTPTAQFNGMEKWFTGGGPKLVESLPTTWSEAIDAWQWVVSEPSSLEAGNMMYATYSDCSLEEGYTLRKVYDLYKDFAIYAQSQGDTVGRKMIFPSAGYDGEADFIRLLYTSSIDGMGENKELFWNKLEGSEASQNLKGFSCSNPREYIGQPMRG